MSLPPTAGSAVAGRFIEEKNLEMLAEVFTLPL